jgi:nucleotide-binding universal stress UspA family protein
MIGRVLVAYDASPCARLALDDAVAVALRDRATLTIVHVVPPVSTLVLFGGAGPASVVHAGARQEATTAIRELSRWMPADVPYTTLIRFGRPAAEILAVLRERPFDVVFLGRRSLARRVAPRTSVEVRAPRMPQRRRWTRGVRLAARAHRA